MNLDAEAVVLGLDSNEAELLDDRLWVRKAFSQLAAKRFPDCDFQSIQPALTLGPQSSGDQTEVGSPVVSAFEQWSKRPIPSLGE